MPELASPRLEIFERGREAAERVLFLHDLDYANSTEYPFIASLAETWWVMAPSHPGFGGSPLPDGFDAIDDLAYSYLDLLDERGPAHVIGAGFGAWIAAEMAVRCRHDIRSLVLVDALGIKVGDRTTSDIKDLFVVSPQELLALCWHDRAMGESLMALPDARYEEEALVRLLTGRQTAALMGWNPFMHNPKLLGRLRRIDCPTLVVWGASDRLVSPDYGRAYAAAIPGARFALIDEAGHYPYLEKPNAFNETVVDFLRSIPPTGEFPRTGEGNGPQRPNVESPR